MICLVLIILKVIVNKINFGKIFFIKLTELKNWTFFYNALWNNFYRMYTINVPLEVNNRIISLRRFQIFPKSREIFRTFEGKLSGYLLTKEQQFFYPMPFFGEASKLFWLFYILRLLLFKNIFFSKPFFPGSLKKRIWVVKLNFVWDKICDYQAVI